jgi:glycopeptide antibiotics resistance protein
MNSDKLDGYLGNQGTVFIMYKLVLILCFVFMATTICKDTKFISYFVPITTIAVTVLVIYDYYFTQISGSQFLYRVLWMASVFMAEIAVMLGILFSRANDYRIIQKRFWIGFTPLYVFVLILCFARTPFGRSMTLNLQPFQGTFLMLKAFVKDVNVSFEAPLIFFGNLLIFIPLPFILKTFIKRIKPLQILLIGIAVPIIIEGYQYVFKCGDVDIDDVILNLSGYLIGLVALVLINKIMNQNKKARM